MRDFGGRGEGGGWWGSALDVAQRFLEEAEGFRIDLVVVVEFVERNLASAPLAALDQVKIVILIIASDLICNVIVPLDDHVDLTSNNVGVKVHAF